MGKIFPSWEKSSLHGKNLPRRSRRADTRLTFPNLTELFTKAKKRAGLLTCPSLLNLPQF